MNGATNGAGKVRGAPECQYRFQNSESENIADFEV